MIVPSRKVKATPTLVCGASVMAAAKRTDDWRISHLLLDVKVMLEDAIAKESGEMPALINEQFAIVQLLAPVTTNCDFNKTKMLLFSARKVHDDMNHSPPCPMVMFSVSKCTVY